MSSKKKRRKHLAVRLLDKAIGKHRMIAKSGSSYKPNTDTSVAMFQKNLKRLWVLVDDEMGEQEFWTLVQKTHIRLLKETLKLRN